MWHGNGEIDLVLFSREENTCLVTELKSFIAPAEPREIINRSAEIAKGIMQIKKRRENFHLKPDALTSTIGVPQNAAIYWAVISENSIGANYVQDVTVPVVARRHLAAELQATRSLKAVCEWLTTRKYLPQPGTHFEEVAIDSMVGRFTVGWYGIRLHALGQ